MHGKFSWGGLIALSLLLNLSACDIVNPPLPGVDNSTAVIDTPKIGNDSIRKVLIEDFTGQGCQGCPEAHEVAEMIVQQSKDSVFAIAIHSGHFADPIADLGGNPFPQDFRTEAGEAYEEKPSWIFDGFPNGLVSRRPFKDEIVFDQSVWGQAVDEIKFDVPQIKIASELEFDPSTRELNVTIGTYPLVDLSSTYNLVLSLAESGIVAPQIIDGNNTDEFYVHNHVFRGNINGIWGVPLFTDASADQGSVDVKAYTYTLKDSWIPENTTLVIYVYDTATDEILQVEEYHITN